MYLPKYSIKHILVLSIYTVIVNVVLLTLIISIIIIIIIFLHTKMVVVEKRI